MENKKRAEKVIRVIQERIAEFLKDEKIMAHYKSLPADVRDEWIFGAACATLAFSHEAREKAARK